MRRNRRMKNKKPLKNHLKSEKPVSASIRAAAEALGTAAEPAAPQGGEFYVTLRKQLKHTDRERADRATVRERSKGRCEVELDGARCVRPHQHTHHITKRSQGGKCQGAAALMGICWPHHDLTDNASLTQTTTLLSGEVFHGRLMIVAEGDGTFRCWMESSKVSEQ